MKISKARLVALAATLGLALTSFDAASQPAGGAAAQPAAKEPTKAAKDEASTRFQKGLDLFREADYQAALIEFRRAYELVPNYNVLYNIGQVYLQLQNYADALTSLERYLEEGGKNVSKQRKEDVEKDIAKARSRVGTLDISSNVGEAEVAVDDVLVGKTPLAKPLMVSVGRHKVTATKEGFRPFTKYVEIASADSLKVPLELVEQKAGGDTGSQVQPPNPTVVTPPPMASATAPIGPVKPPPERPGIPWAGWAITGGFAAGAAITGVLALGASSDLAELRTAPLGADGRTQLDDASSKVKTMALVSDILTGCAVVAGGVSLILTIRSASAASAASDSEQPAASPKTSGIQEVRVGVTPGGMQVSGAF